MSGEEDHNDNIPIRFPSMKDKIVIHPVALSGIGQDKGILLEIENEDYTLVNMIRDELIKSQNVIFSGCKKPHPLENKMLLRVHVSGSTDGAGDIKKPRDELVDACIRIEDDLEQLLSDFNF